MTNKPHDHACNTVPAIRDFFTLWIEKLEEFYEERDKRYEDKFAAQDKKTTLAFDNSEKAITKAETATEKRFEGVNEFRQTLADQAARLLPRDEYNVRHESLEKEVKAIVKDIQDLRDTRTESSGRGQGVKQIGGYVVGALGLGATISWMIYNILNSIKLGH